MALVKMAPVLLLMLKMEVILRPSADRIWNCSLSASPSATS